jgi:hypothetical protein
VFTFAPKHEMWGHSGRAGSQSSHKRPGGGRPVGGPSVSLGYFRLTQCVAVCTLSILCSDFGISFASHGIGEGLQLPAVGQFDWLVKTTGPGRNATPQIKNGPIWANWFRTWNATSLRKVQGWFMWPLLSMGQHHRAVLRGMDVCSGVLGTRPSPGPALFSPPEI